MKTYLFLQLKRAARLLPFVLVVALVLFGALLTVFNAIVQQAESEEAENAMLIKVGLTGDTGYEYFDLWLSAIQSFDTSRYAIEIVKLDEEQAKTELEAGKLAAYVILPDRFIEEALAGRIQPITYVTTSGSVDTLSIFKEEVTEVISRLLAESQKGVYGIGEALDENGHEDISFDKLNELNLEYIDVILDRSKTYRVEAVDAEADLPIQTYLFSGVAVLLVFLTALPYALLYVNKETALHRVLAARGYKPWKQLLCEYIAYAVAMAALFLLVLSALALFTDGAIAAIPGGAGLILFAVQLLPVLLMVTACGFLIFELAGNLVTGILLQFFLSLALCYIGGCLYPLYSFPVAVQEVAVYLPAAVARSYLSGCIVEETAWPQLVGLLLYTAVFVAIAVWVRRFRVIGRGGGTA